MKLVRTVAEVRAEVSRVRGEGKVIGLVPTMGFLHEGHLSLIDVARDSGADFIVVSIFVNPKQFAPSEDFGRYPRDEDGDRAQLEARQVDLLFLPDAGEVYPEGFSTAVHVAGLTARLEGERRPGHFDGVATVVLKLFDVVQPDLAVFGKKDAQQCAVIDRMVRDLDIPVQLIFAETVREMDGLAMSSRNSYLTVEERLLAPALHRGLTAGETAITHGIADVAEIEKLMRQIVGLTPGVEIDYVEVVDPETFDRPRDFERDLLLAGAVRIGRTRLIDNIRIASDRIPPARVDAR